MSESSNEIVSVFSNITLGDDGIWKSKDDHSVSYPKEGSEMCFEVENSSYWFRHRNECLTALMKRLPPPKGSLFCDVGGGNGFVSMAVQAAGFPVVLLEPSPVGAYNAKMRGVRNVVCATTDGSGLRNGSLGAVGAFDVIEHIENDEIFVKGLADALNKGGMFYATVPAWQSLWSEEDEWAGHFRRYRLPGFNALFEKAGLEILYSSYIFSMLPVPIWALRTLPNLFGVKRKQDPRQMVKDHGSGSAITRNLMGASLRPEIAMVRKLHKIPFGSSCFVACRKG